MCMLYMCNTHNSFKCLWVEFPVGDFPTAVYSVRVVPTRSSWNSLGTQLLQQQYFSISGVVSACDAT